MTLDSISKDIQKKCIFYLPYKLDPIGAGARMIRPKKMIEAFENIGYDVYVIQGYSKERKQSIRKLKQKMDNGTEYSFMYTESSTEPTLLTNPSHYPTHPIMDFDFFKQVKQKGIKIGLFYCDIYWKFKEYGKGLSFLKKFIAIENYKYDLKQYERLLDCIFVPDMGMDEYIGKETLSNIMYELPPGADNIEMPFIGVDGERNFKTDPLKIFYVGGLGGHYKIQNLVQAVSELNNCSLTICCRKEEFEKEKINYEKLLNEKITVIHKSGKELEKYYRDADIGSLLFESDAYRKMAKPFKAYEYFAHELPVISTRGTAIGDIVEKNKLGFNVDYDVDSIKAALNLVLQTPRLLLSFKENCRKYKSNNLWTSRARCVEQLLGV